MGSPVEGEDPAVPPCGCHKTTSRVDCLLPQCGSWGLNSSFRFAGRCLYPLTHLPAPKHTLLRGSEVGKFAEERSVSSRRCAVGSLQMPL